MYHVSCVMYLAPRAARGAERERERERDGGREGFGRAFMFGICLHVSDVLFCFKCKPLHDCAYITCR